MRRSLGPCDKKKLFLMDNFDLKLISEEELDAMTDDIDESRENRKNVGIVGKGEGEVGI